MTTDDKVGIMTTDDKVGIMTTDDKVGIMQLMVKAKCRATRIHKSFDCCYACHYVLSVWLGLFELLHCPSDIFYQLPTSVLLRNGGNIFIPQAWHIYHSLSLKKPFSCIHHASFISVIYCQRDWEGSPWEYSRLTHCGLVTHSFHNIYQNDKEITRMKSADEYLKTVRVWLAHGDPETPFGDIGLGHHWFR